jgi:hypothetical protein
MKAVMKGPLTYDDIASEYDKVHQTKARTLTFAAIIAWARKSPRFKIVNGNFYLKGA